MQMRKRVRDKDKPCISYKRPLTNKYDAGQTAKLTECLFSEDLY